MRRIHYTRLLDLVTGSAFAAVKTKDTQKIYKDFNLAKLNETRFREIVTANLPIFYVVDLDLIAKEVLNGIVSDPKRFISSIYTEIGPVAPGEDGFEKSLSHIAKQESDVYKQAYYDIVTESKKALTSKLKTSSFLAMYSELEKFYNRAIGTLSLSGQTYTKYRNAAIKLQFDIRKYMSTMGVFVASDGNQIARVSQDQLVIIGSSFDLAVRRVNDTLLPVVEKLLEEKYNIVTTKNTTGFKIGNLVNAGHTAAVSESGSIIGVNMPSAQEMQFRLGGSPKSFEIEQQLGQLYLDVGYSVTFTQNFTEKASSLLDMQFAFVVSQPAKLNTDKIRTEEGRRIKNIIENTILPSIEEQVRKKTQDGTIDFELFSASPNTLEYIELQLTAALSGQKAPSLRKTSKAKKNTKLAIPVLELGKAVKSATKKKTASLSNLKIGSKALSSTAGISLASLQVLLNNSLVEQIKRNMGDGSRRDILNLRSGRFAESVKVERLSESREGMITAFYSYMKNPYATFSRGGQQERPYTRDPKLLIAKSIREIASQQVANRLRAVNV